MQCTSCVIEADVEKKSTVPAPGLISARPRGIHVRLQGKTGSSHVCVGTEKFAGHQRRPWA